MASQTASSESIPARILIVDDHPNTASMLARALRGFGASPFNVLTAYSGEEALKIIGNDFVDVLITDFMMPGMNGFELLEHLRQTHPETGRVLITAFGSLWVEEQAHRLADAYLLKPFELPDLIEAIQHIFDSRENNNEH